MTGDGAFWFAVFVRAVLLLAAVVNIVNATRMYHVFHDSRGLRSLVMSLSIFGGTLALVGSSQAIRDSLPAIAPSLRILVSAGLMMFSVGLLWSVWTWRLRP